MGDEAGYSTSLCGTLVVEYRRRACAVRFRSVSCHLFLQRDISLPDQSDRLADARDVFAELYAYAEKEPPEYVPLETPAEQEHDPGRRKRISALSDGLCELDFKDDGRIVADFSAHLDQQQCWEFQKGHASPYPGRYLRAGGSV